MQKVHRDTFLGSDLVSRHSPKGNLHRLWRMLSLQHTTESRSTFKDMRVPKDKDLIFKEIKYGLQAQSLKDKK